MPMAGPEPYSYRRKDPAGEQPSPKDPLDELVETLQEEFRRGLAREKVQQDAARRKRITLLIVSLLIVASSVLAAVVLRGAIHLPH
jgi:hypothetical protein